MIAEGTYKIFRMSEWLGFAKSGSFEGSPDDIRDGFIHLSAAEQIEGVLERYFRGQTAVVVAEVDCGRTGGRLEWETSTGGVAYPHYYGALIGRDIVRARRLEAGNGRFSLPVWPGGGA